MVQMSMREVDVDIERRQSRQLQPQRPNPRAGIEQQPAVARAHLQA